MSVYLSVWMRFRVVVVVVGLVAGVLCGGGPVWAQDEATPMVGSFGVGGGVMASVDEATGVFSTQVPVGSLPGLASSVSQSDEGVSVQGMGGFDVGVSYRQGGMVTDRFGLGGWVWGMTFVDTDGGVRVFPASGGVFYADASVPSGLGGYLLGDLVFSQQEGVLPARVGGGGEVSYAYVLEYTSGVRDYFSGLGDLVARVGVFDADRVDVVWGAGHRLLGVVDGGGNRVDVVWTGAGVEVIFPGGEASKGGVKTVFEVVGGRLVSVVNAVGDWFGFRYEQQMGLLEQFTSVSGAVTQVTYQTLVDGSVAVDRVRVVDGGTGVQLSERRWQVLGEHTASGWPTYTDQRMLWGSGDGGFRFRTVLSDGVTDVVSEYNSLGLLVSRDVGVEMVGGDVVARSQRFTYPGTEDGGVPSGVLPKQYSRPVVVESVVRDAAGRSRVVVERSEYDELGQVVKHVGVDGAVTETVYDKGVPVGWVLPLGFIREQTVTGVDGKVSKVVNTTTSDGKAVGVTETFVGDNASGLVSTRRGEVTVEPDGFVSSSRVRVVGQGLDVPVVVVTGFDRVVDRGSGVVTLVRTDAVGRAEQFVSKVVVDVSTGLPVGRVDGLGRVASSVYDSLGRVSEEVDFQKRRTVSVYERGVSRVRDPRGVVRSEYVDVLGRVVKVTDNIATSGDGVVVAGSGVERVVEKRLYEQNSSRVTTVDVLGRRTVTVSDVFGRPVRVTGPSGVAQVFERDDVSNEVSSGVVAGSGSGLGGALRVSTVRRDDVGRDVGVRGVRGDGVPVAEETTTFDGLGRVVGSEGNDLSTSVVFNADGTPRVTKTVPQGAGFPGEVLRADREHNVLGVSTKKTLSYVPGGLDVPGVAGAGAPGVTDVPGGVREGVSRVVDVLGRTVSKTDQAGGVMVFEYTVDGLVSVEDNRGSGVVTQYTYDEVTRALVGTRLVDREGRVVSRSFEYDPVLGVVTAVFDPLDREGTQIRYTYDLLGDRTGTFYPDGKTVSAVFDEYGRKVRGTDVVGNITGYGYDGLGLLSVVTQTRGDGTGVGSVVYEYDVFGRLRRVSRDSGLVTTYTFTSADEIASEKTVQGGVLVYGGTYGYDSHGNLSTRVVTRPSVGGGGESTETTAYGYNAYDQLVSSVVYSGFLVGGVEVSRVGYEVDVAGNVTGEVSSSGDGVVVREFEHDVLGHVTGVVTDGNRVEQLYDLAGNLTQGSDGTRYTYNVANQPVRETRCDGSVVEHTYWVNGQRESVTTTYVGGGAERERASVGVGLDVGGVTQRVGMYWDGATLVNDTYSGGEAGVGTASYLVGLSRHTRTLTSGEGLGEVQGPEYYVTDRHGSTVSMVTAGGRVSVGYGYTDYGVPTRYVSEGLEQSLGSVNPFQYSGEYTTGVGVQYLGGRVYVPEVMGFTTRDTAELFNVYAYSGANPVTFVDPSGQKPGVDTIFSGVVLGVLLLAGVVSCGLFVAAWAMAGVVDIPGMVMTGVDGVSSLGAGLVLGNAERDEKGKLFGEDVAKPLLWASTLIGGVSAVISVGCGVLSLGEAISSREAQKVSAVATGLHSEGDSLLAHSGGGRREVDPQREVALNIFQPEGSDEPTTYYLLIPDAEERQSVLDGKGFLRNYPLREAAAYPSLHDVGNYQGFYEKVGQLKPLEAVSCHLKPKTATVRDMIDWTDRGRRAHWTDVQNDLNSGVDAVVVTNRSSTFLWFNKDNTKIVIPIEHKTIGYDPSIINRDGYKGAAVAW